MTPERHRQIIELFQSASELSDDQREPFIAESCAGDEELRRDVYAMLAADQRAGTFLEEPPADVAAAVMGGMKSQPVIGETLGDYKVIARLGRGGMGEVFLAEDTRLGRMAALKLLPGEYATNPVRLREFEQEARAVSALNHPNIVTVYGTGQAASVHFLATEYVPGTTLRELVANGPLVPARVVEIAIEITSALAAAHSAGIVHRDIKPENIIVRPDSLVKILDFGIAQRIDPPRIYDTLPGESERAAVPGLVIGTPAYMSPEQARGLPVDARTDIFSLGCVLYELVSGCPTVTGDTASDVIAALSTEQPIPIASLRSKCPAALVRVIGRAIEKDCEKRYQTSADMLAHLRSVRNGISTAHASGRRRLYRLAATLSFLLFTALTLWYLLSPGTRIRSIAVMPFTNEGGVDLQYLADGLTDSLISDLSQVPQLKVISRNSVFRFKGREADPAVTGALLRAQAVLVGRVMQNGDRLSVRLELVDVRDNHRLWGEQYNRMWADLPLTQAEITSEVLSKLRIRLSDATEQELYRRRTVKPEAYRLFLKGLFYFERYGIEDVKTGIGYFHEALEEDPTFARAYVALAHSYVTLASSTPPREAMSKARVYALKALDLQGALAEAHVALGIVRLLYDWDWLGAEQEFRYESRLNPDSVDTFACYLHFSDILGRADEGVAKLARHLASDPMSPVNNLELGCVAYYARHYDMAISQYWRTIHLAPELAIAYANVGRAYVQKRMYPEAITELEKGLKLDSSGTLLLSELGYALAASGRRAAARNILKQLKVQASHHYVDAALLAPVYIQLADRDEAFRCLERAYIERSSSMPWLEVDPKFDPVRSDPRYRDLLRRVGFKS